MRRIRFAAGRLLRFLGRASGTPEQIARGVAIGFVVAWLPIVGIQMVVAITVCTVFRANRVVPLFPIWLTNPATLVPVYSFNYWVGWMVVGGPPLGEITGALKKMIPAAPPEDMGWLEGWWHSGKSGLVELLHLGWEAQLPLWIGCVIVGAAPAVPSYYLTRWAIVKFRQAVHRKREQRGIRLRERLRRWREERQRGKARRASERLPSASGRPTPPEPPSPPAS
jgi:uncharacterized protein (DUF2062 family)